MGWHHDQDHTWLTKKFHLLPLVFFLSPTPVSSIWRLNTESRFWVFCHFLFWFAWVTITDYEGRPIWEECSGHMKVTNKVDGIRHADVTSDTCRSSWESRLRVEPGLWQGANLFRPSAAPYSFACFFSVLVFVRSGRPSQNFHLYIDTIENASSGVRVFFVRSKIDRDAPMTRYDDSDTNYFVRKSYDRSINRCI